MSRFFLPFLLAFALALAACTAPAPASTPTLPLMTPPGTPSPTGPSATLPVDESLPAATATGHPALPTPTLDPEVLALDLITQVRAGGEPQQAEEAVSPDGRFTARLTLFPCVPVEHPEYTDAVPMAYDEIILSGPAGEEVIASQLQYCEGLGAHGLGQMGWSPGSTTLYFTTAREGEPDGGGACGWWPQIMAYKVSNGELAPLSEGPLSPDGTTLATVVYHATGRILFWDLDRGTIGASELMDSGLNVTAMAWSPDGQQLAYALGEFPCTAGDRSMVVVVPLGGGEPVVVHESPDVPVLGLEWRGASTLALETVSGGEVLVEVD